MYVCLCAYPAEKQCSLCACMRVSSVPQEEDSRTFSRTNVGATFILISNRHFLRLIIEGILYRERRHDLNVYVLTLLKMTLLRYPLPSCPKHVQRERERERQKERGGEESEPSRPQDCSLTCQLVFKQRNPWLKYPWDAHTAAPPHSTQETEAAGRLQEVLPLPWTGIPTNCVSFLVIIHKHH